MEEQYLVEVEGRTYGPADSEQLLQWVREGRVDRTTILIHRGTGERLLAAHHPDLRVFFQEEEAGAMRLQYNPYSPYSPQETASSGLYSAPVLQYAKDENDSGYGPTAQLPASLQGLNWGAFFIPFWWGITHRTWISLLVLIPCIGWVVPPLLLIKGNEYAWQNRRFASEKEFETVQSAWRVWGMVSLIGGVLLSLWIWKAGQG